MRRKPVAYALLISFIAVGCGDKSPANNAGATGGGATSTEKGKPGELAALKIEDTKVGKGKPAAAGDMIWVLYTGKLADGTVFDSTSKRGNQPFTVPIGAGQVIKGWDQGLVGMKVGGERKLSIPWKLGYGEGGSEQIPGRADLFFDIKALALVKKGEEDIVTIESESKGKGAEVQPGDKVTFGYKISLLNGVVADEQKQVTAVVGKEIDIPGIDSGIVGMKEGGKRRLVIPPMAGIPYGKGKIPGQSVIIVDLTIKKVQKGKKA